jgi:hypothetical protein
VKNAGGDERLQNHIAGPNRCADTHANTTEGALDVINCQDPRRDESRPDGCAEDTGPWDVQGIDMSS